MIIAYLINISVQLNNFPEWWFLLSHMRGWGGWVWVRCIHHKSLRYLRTQILNTSHLASKLDEVSHFRQWIVQPQRHTVTFALLIFIHEFLSTVYLFFSSSSLFDFFLCAGMSWASKSLASSLSFFAFDWGSLVNWKVNELPSWSTSWICILELPSGLIRCTVEHKENEFEHLHAYRKRQVLYYYLFTPN